MTRAPWFVASFLARFLGRPRTPESRLGFNHMRIWFVRGPVRLGVWHFRFVAAWFTVPVPREGPWCPWNWRRPSRVGVNSN